MIKRYNAVQLGQRYYVNDPDTMQMIVCSSMRSADLIARHLNDGAPREHYEWIQL